MKAGPRILIVEDNPDDEALLMRQLKKADLHEHVKAIHDGKKALAYITFGVTETGALRVPLTKLRMGSGSLVAGVVRTIRRSRPPSCLISQGASSGTGAPVLGWTTTWSKGQRNSRFWTPLTTDSTASSAIIEEI